MSGIGTTSAHPSVLLADDQPAIVDRATRALAPHFDIVSTVSDGAAALAAVNALHPNVVVLDISMPGMSGLDVAARLRAEDSTSAIVFLSVHEEAEIVGAARSTGGLAYVLKRRLASDLVKATLAAAEGRRFASEDVAVHGW